MPNYIINIVTHPLFGLITGLAGFLIGHHLQLGRDRLGRFNDAAQKFRDAFREEYYYFSPEAKGLIYFHNVISQSEVKHRAAYDEFINYLPRLRRASFARAWQTYCDHINNYDYVEKVNERNAAVSAIYFSMRDLLSYANPK